jgi:hypothetical protein
MEQIRNVQWTEQERAAVARRLKLSLPIALAAAILSLGAGPARGSVAAPSSGPTASDAQQASALTGGSDDNGFSHVRTDLKGNVVLTEQRNHIPAFATASSEGGVPAQADATSPAAPALANILPLNIGEKRFDGCCSPSGCDLVDAWRNHYSLLGFLVWRFHQLKYWCWTYPRIHTGSLSIGSKFTNVDSQQVVNWDDHGYGYYYQWAGSPYGGHFSDRNGSVSNCVFRIGCLSTSYPYVDIWINGNGAFTAQWGG